MKYIIYTDGAYSQMNDEGAYAFVILTEQNNEVKRFAEKITRETNNRAELKAIINAVLQLPQDATYVAVYTDSRYALHTLSGTWKRKANRDLFVTWDDVIKERGLTIEYNWVRGHNGNEYNELCDKLCNDAIGYDANEETDVFRKEKKSDEIVSISKERYEFLLRCEELIKNNIMNKIYLGYCLTLMPNIADKSVDCILCDLPYGTTKNHWDSIIPLDKLWEQYKRIIKDDGAIVLFSQQPFTSMLVMSNPKMFKYEWIWEKENGTGFLNANHAPLKIHENILVFGKGATSPTRKSVSMTYNPQKTKGKPYTAVQGYSGSNYSPTVGNVTISDGMRYPTDIIKFNRDKEKYHSTQKPVELCQYIIRTYTNSGGVILDNCMGSGSTIVAAIRENRQYIGIEKDEKYFDIANKRIAAETSQLSLF